MLSRKEQTQKPRPLPDLFCQSLKDSLSTLYKELGTFDVYGAAWPNEMLLAASLSKKDSLPVTYMASVDLTEGQNTHRLQDILTNRVEKFFDHIKGHKDWNDYRPVWTQTKESGISFYEQSCREDIALYLEAERLLAQNPGKS